MAQLRVVSFLESSTEMVQALGCGDWLVGRFQDAGALDSEALAALRPDVVITDGMRGVLANGLERSRGTGGRARLVAIAPCTLDDVWRDFRSVADALGVPERGVQQVTRLQARMRSVAARAAGLTPGPRVAFLTQLDPIRAAGGWMAELVRLAGASDPFGTSGAAAARIGRDRLRVADPDAIWIAYRGLDIAGARRELAAAASRPDWKRLRAVRAGAVFLGDGRAYFHRPGPRVAEALECLVEALRPDAFRFGHEGKGWARGT
jgi:iron complex transport system substrate-binding protein